MSTAVGMGMFDMVSNKPVDLDESTRDRAKAKAWQGALVLVIGAGTSAITWFGLGFVWWGTILMGVAGLFWMLTGLITVFTDYE